VRPVDNKEQASSKVQFVEINQESVGQRLDNFLIRRLKGVPKSRIYRIIRKGEVRINKKRSKPEQKLQAGDMVRLPPVVVATRPAQRKPSDKLAALLHECILFEDDNLLVLDKPAGFSVHGGSGIGLGLIEALRQLKPQWHGLELAHRLDRDTSGCLIVAKNSLYLRYLHELFKENTIKKTYRALVCGYWPETLQEVAAPLLKNNLQSGERVVVVDPAGKTSLTRFRLIKRYPHASLIEAMPKTGRTHQIRVHCQHAGHPIVGDAKYCIRNKAGQLAQVKQLCLHASSIEFIEADGSQTRHFAAALPRAFAQLLQSLT